NRRKPPSLVWRWVRRVLLGVGLLLLLAIALVLGVSLYLRVNGASRLAAAVAEADRLDPGWRWGGLEKNRTPLPGAGNAALKVEAAAKHLPGTAKWPPEHSPLEQVRELESVVQPSEDQVKALRAELGEVAPALAEARGLVSFRIGRFPARSIDDFFDGLL